MARETLFCSHSLLCLLMPLHRQMLEYLQVKWRLRFGSKKRHLLCHQHYACWWPSTIRCLAICRHSDGQVLHALELQSFCINLFMLRSCIYFPDDPIHSVTWATIGSGNGLLPVWNKSLPEPTLVYCLLNASEQILMRSQSICPNFHSRYVFENICKISFISLSLNVLSRKFGLRSCKYYVQNYLYDVFGPKGSWPTLKNSVL